jgi:hypothetical protein
MTLATSPIQAMRALPSLASHIVPRSTGTVNAWHRQTEGEVRIALPSESWKALLFD